MSNLSRCPCFPGSSMTEWSALQGARAVREQRNRNRKGEQSCSIRTGVRRTCHETPVVVPNIPSIL
eukprot:2100362-Prymnesium_polylepis.1